VELFITGLVIAASFILFVYWCVQAIRLIWLSRSHNKEGTLGTDLDRNIPGASSRNEVGLGYQISAIYLATQPGTAVVRQTDI
jgi:hypothetical protein